jgi:hypothetical protein
MEKENIKTKQLTISENIIKLLEQTDDISQIDLKECYDNIKKLAEQRIDIDIKLEDVNKQQNEIREKQQYINSRINDLLMSIDYKLDSIKTRKSYLTREKEKYDRYAELDKTKKLTWIEEEMKKISKKNRKEEESVSSLEYRMIHDKQDLEVYLLIKAGKKICWVPNDEQLKLFKPENFDWDEITKQNLSLNDAYRLRDYIKDRKIIELREGFFVNKEITELYASFSLNCCERKDVVVHIQRIFVEILWNIVKNFIKFMNRIVNTFVWIASNLVTIH